MNEKYVLGLDIGISSVGWGLLRLDEENNPIRIIDTGVKIFSPGEVPKTGASKNLNRRQKRGIRRISRRREFRVDRIRYLLNLNGYLGESIVTGKVSEINDELTILYNNMLNDYYKDKNINPYMLKVEALDRKLSKDELSIILVHYAKHRGYKSNREEDSSDSENGKVKSSIEENKKIMEESKYRIISEMFINDNKFKERIRNTNGDYKMCVTREMYLEEIEKVLNAQIKYGLITEDFKNEYVEIWSSQRHYAKGPGGDSKYGGNLIEKMTGKCKFDNKPRAPKCAPSSEIFVALTNLVNFRYKSKRNDEYQNLNSEQIKKIIELAKNQDSITYNKVFKELGIENGIVKGISATSKEKASAINAFKKKNKLTEFEYGALNEEEKNVYDNLKIEEINKREFIKLKSYSFMRKEFIKQLGTLKWEEISENLELLDLIAKILTDYKLDDDVEKAIKDNDIDEIYKDAILALPNFKDHIMLSSDLVRKINAIMIEGITYDEAMSKLGYSHTDLNSEKEKFDLLIPINQDEELNNQRVIRSLSQARGIINSIIKKYGMPERINIETARELAKSREERNEIAKKRDENQEKNKKIKLELVSLGIFNNIENVKATDVLKYKLWKEQACKCAYSLEAIPIEYLFKDNLVQIDHILPYSRTFDDTYFNKTLVLSKYNQDKGSKTPYEWLGKTEKWLEYKGFISNLDISEKKKENYLLLKLTPEIENDFRNQNLNDTKFISKYLVSYIKANLNVSKVGCPSGSITGKLRNYWNLNGLTHSLDSETYYINNRDENFKKNRENNLHHAMDALVIAATNDKVIRRVSNYERYKRYLDNKPLEYIIDYGNKIDDNFDVNQFVDENGELQEGSLKDYIKDLRANEYFIGKHNNTIRTYVPEPYKGFVNEAKIRVYEQNKEIMDFKLKEFNYSDSEINNALPIIPKFAKDKIGGSLHGETYYSLRVRKSGEDEVKSQISRIDLNSDSFDSKKLENILEKGGGSKVVYETIKEWIGEEKGSIAYKKNGGYPINPKTGNMIKKIKIENEYKGKGHLLGEKIVDKADICQIDVYKKNGEEKLYFVAYDALDLYQIKEKKDKCGNIIKKSQNIDVDIWWGQGKNHMMMSFSSLNNEYQKYLSLKKNDLVEIELNNGNKGCGYVTGCTSGMIEIKSPLGDGKDLIGKNLLFQQIRDRYTITISTIKNINKIKISNLGKVEEWDIDKFL